MSWLHTQPAERKREETQRLKRRLHEKESELEAERQRADKLQQTVNEQSQRETADLGSELEKLQVENRCQRTVFVEASKF